MAEATEEASASDVDETDAPEEEHTEEEPPPPPPK